MVYLLTQPVPRLSSVVYQTLLSVSSTIFGLLAALCAQQSHFYDWAHHPLMLSINFTYLSSNSVLVITWGPLSPSRRKEMECGKIDTTFATQIFLLTTMVNVLPTKSGRFSGLI